MFCPICGSRSFADFRGRRGVACTGCQSLERHRIFALFALEWRQRLDGRKIHLLAPGKALQPVPLVAPDLFAVSSVAKLMAARRIDALFLAQQFEAFDMPVARLFAELRRKVPKEGVVAFTHIVTDGVAAHEQREVVGEDGTARMQSLFGLDALSWFRTLPGWRMEFWDPRPGFGPAANEEMVLRYAPELATHNRLVVATRQG